MKFKKTIVGMQKNILANDHYGAIPYNCSSLTPDSNGIVKAGTIIPKNDSTAIGVLLYDVAIDENPNGAIAIHGFIRREKIPAVPTNEAIGALSNITFIDSEGKPLKASVTNTEEK